MDRHAVKAAADLIAAADDLEDMLESIGLRAAAGGGGSVQGMDGKIGCDAIERARNRYRDAVTEARYRGIVP